MRLLFHRGQVLLLLVVGVLAGVAVAGVCLELCGVSVLGALRVNELFVQPSSPLPSQIVIGQGSTMAPTTVPAVPASVVASEPVQPDTPRASPTTAVVPGAVYTYPPETSGGGGGGGGRGRGGRGG